MHQIDQEVFSVSSARIRVLKPVPAVIPFQDASMGPFTSFGLSIITLEDEDGYRGEAPIFSSYTNILEKCLFPILFHSRTIPYNDLYPKMYWSIRNEGFRGQASALLGQIDLALYDLAARRKQVPVYRYLNSTRNEISMYASGGGTNYSYAELEKEVSFFLDQGADTIKIKVGLEHGTKMAEDAARVRFVRELIGKNVKLAVDANQVWNCEQALKFLDRIENEGIEWFEEPIHSASYAEIEQLCKRSPVKISYGESERSAKMFPALVNAGVAHLQPVPTLLGGVNEWLEVKDLALRSGRDFSSGGFMQYTTSLMATAPENWQVEYLYTIMHGLNPYFLESPRWVNGKFLLPETPGMAAKVDWGYCEKENKILTNQYWTRDQVCAYNPTVNM